SPSAIAACGAPGDRRRCRGARRASPSRAIRPRPAHPAGACARPGRASARGGWRPRSPRRIAARGPRATGRRSRRPESRTSPRPEDRRGSVWEHPSAVRLVPKHAAWPALALAGRYLTLPDSVAGIAPMPRQPVRTHMIHGSIPALITPFRDGIVDERAFQGLVERQIVEGSHALVPCGTTGESVTLSDAEHGRVVDLCVEAAAGRAPVIAGAGSNNTEHAIALARRA